MAVVLGRRGGSGGGGVPPSGSARVLGPFPFAYDDADINNGVAFWTPAVGDVLLDAWIDVYTQFDGTTPKADIGIAFASGGDGFFVSEDVPIDLTVVSSSPVDSNLLMDDGPPPTSLSLNVISINLGSSFIPRRYPATFLSANPLKVVVSQDGKKGGAAVGGTAGSGAVYLVVATPSLT